MARGNPSPIQRGEAYKIAKKLGAIVRPGGNHMRALVYWEGTLIKRFGIRHSKRSGHGHIPKQLSVSLSDALAIASCAMSKEQYIALLDEKNII